MSWSLNLSEIERGDLRTKAEEAFQASGNNHAEGDTITVSVSSAAKLSDTA